MNILHRVKSSYGAIQMAASIRKKLTILQCGKSWARCFASFSRAYGRQKSPSEDNVYKGNEKDDMLKKIEKIFEDIYSSPVKETEREYYKTHLNPDWEGHKRSVFESRFYSKKHGISDEFKSWLYWDININDDLELQAFADKKEFIQLKKHQRYLNERTQALGVDLGAAHFVVARDGAIKFTSRDVWFAKNAKGEYSLPRVYVDELFVEAIDASNTKLTHVAFDTLGLLEKIRFLRFHNCPHIDDWCLAKLYRVKNSLEFLDLSNCPVTDHGLISLQTLRNLKCLKVSNLAKVKHLGLITVLLEEVIPGLTVIGVDEEDLKPPAWNHRGERKLVRALLGLMDGEEEQEVSEVTEIGNIRNELLKRYARRVD